MTTDFFEKCCDLMISVRHYDYHVVANAPDGTSHLEQFEHQRHRQLATQKAVENIIAYMTGKD